MTAYAKNVVVYNNQPVYQLSTHLIQRQGVTDEQLERLKELHIKKLKLFDEMSATDDTAKLKEGALRLQAIEFAMQDNWNFPQDPGMHEWYLIPKCTCPRMDNIDRRFPGSKLRIISETCPVHGR